MNRLNKTISDLSLYIREMKKMMKDCSPRQREDLNQILKSLIKLLVGFRKGTRMGEYRSPFDL